LNDVVSYALLRFKDSFYW